MSDNKKYFLRIESKLVSVEKDLYLCYYKAKRREKYQNESDLVHGLISYNAMDTDELCGEEMIPDTSESVEDIIMTKMMIEKLNKCFAKLTADEQWLIDELFYQEKNQEEVGKNLNITQQAISKRITKIFSELKKSLES